MLGGEQGERGDVQTGKTVVKKMAPVKNETLIKIAFLVAMAVLASIVFVSHGHIAQWTVLDQRESHTFDLVRKMDRLLIGLSEVKRGQRGYSRTRSEEHLRTYRKGKADVERELAALKELTAQHPRQRDWLAQIEPLVRAKLAQRQMEMEAPPGAPPPKPAPNHVFTEQIQRRIAAARDQAIRELRDSSTRQVAEMVKVQRFAVAKAVALFLLAGTVFLLLKRDIARRRESELELIEHRDQLDRLVQTRTRELEQTNQQLQVEMKEREKSDLLLKQAHQRLVDTLESMTDGFVSLDRNWRYTYVNGAAAALMGKSGAELLGQECWQVFPGSETSLAYRELRRAMRDNCFLEFEDYRGEPLNRWYANRCYPSADGLTIYFTDVTRQKWAEEVRRDLNQHLDLVREEERLAISREVHDGIGQSLTALQLDLSWLERRCEPDQAEVGGRLAEMRGSLDELIVKVQHITAELRPPLLDNLGLAAALEWQAREFGRRSGTECHLMLNEGIEVTNRQAATNMLRIFQEALANIARHARSSEVCISLCELADRVILEISDNGCGISEEALASNTAYGIMGMRERARLCRGELNIKGEAGLGTTVTLEMPRSVLQEEM